MRRLLSHMVVTTVLLAGWGAAACAQTIDQRLVVVTNDLTIGGHFNIGVEVRGNSLPVANTLGSATIDVVYDNTMLTFVNSSLWAFGLVDGYIRGATNNTTFIRVGVTGGGVGPSQSTVGFDIGTGFTRWVQINFTIVGDGPTNLTIDPGTNAIGLFDNHQNSPETGAIHDQTLGTRTNLLNTPLPIQLTKFLATAQSGGAVKLEWQTASEIDNYGFEVQRSSDKSTGFVSINGSFQAGHGTSLEVHQYSWTDISASSAEPWYRLKQTDLDQSVHYSEAQQVAGLTSVREAAPLEFQLLQNYPNPFNPATQITFSVKQTGPATLKVYSMLGQEVATLFEGQAEAGQYYRLTLDGHRLASGVYLYRLVSGDKKDIKRLVLMK